MGKVYCATNRSTGQVVALKAIRKSRQFDTAAVTRFVQEARILSGLSHPNIVRVQGLGQFPSGGLFMVMDYVEGEDLQKRIERSLFSVEQARSIALSIAEALDYLHRHGIVHGDLKPSNVIIDPSDNVVLVDFGFATLLAEPVSAQLVGGTFGYLAPEVLNLVTPPSVASDIYSYGVVVTEMLEACTDRNAERVRRTLGSTGADCAHPDVECRPRNLNALLRRLNSACG